MTEKRLFVGWLAHAYALGMSALMLSMPTSLASWFGQLPWLYWGTDIVEAFLLGDAPQAGSVWLALLWVQFMVSMVWLLTRVVLALMALLFDAVVLQVRARAHDTPGTPVAPTEDEEGHASSPAHVMALVEDPDIRQLMQDLDRRLKA